LKGVEFDVAVVKTAHDWRTLLRDVAVVLVIRRRRRPVVLQLHGSHPSALVQRGSHAFKLATALLLRLVDAVLVLSTEEQRQWQEFRGRPPVFTVKNPYVRVFPSDRPTRRDTEHPRLLFVGRLIREKGVFDVVDALPHVLERTQVTAVIAGEGPDEAELRRLVRERALEAHVVLPGYLEGAELEAAYREATLFVFPTRWDEGFPTVLAEAMDAGLPIVTTRIRGAADHLVAGENALFVEPRDVSALVDAILTLLDDRYLAARMSAANRRRIGIFEPRVVADEYLGVLQAVART
jgi:glycosyltransferase involved in cell wall biosynthesis